MSAVPDQAVSEQAADLLVSYSLFHDTTPTATVDRDDVPWPELVARIRDAPTYLDKAHCPLFSFAQYGSTPSANGCIRHAANIMRVFGGEIDYDGERITPVECAQLLQQANIRAVIYTSPRHKADAPRWRVLLPFSEPTLPEKRAEYVGRANRVLGGIASSESFRLSQSFYIGRVQGAAYDVIETHGRCIDLAAEIEPLIPASCTNSGEMRFDATSDAQLRAAFERGEGRYEAMLKLSSRWAARGMAVDDIESALATMLGTGSTRNAQGIDLRTRIRPIAESAARKFGETRAGSSTQADGEKTRAEDNAKAAGVDELREWAPPAVATYGASFDASKIPLRRWLLGRRRAIGELTVDIGPPGVNKSTLMLTDAVGICTGRKLLADEVHVTGEVLLLAGEDARRDIEARLAGILARYHLVPAELANRLHVVYLAEIDASIYTLARMSEDLACLNLRMFQWLRQYPALVAVLLDPIAAWHQLLENSNEAQQLLCSSLRALAVQGNRHVGFDHHVTKISQVDPEAHVGNLTAIRGASAIAANVRWAFTMARLKPETAIEHGVTDEERRRYRRLDPLKASYGPDDDAVRLLHIDSVGIANGETVGVLVEVDMARTREGAAERKASATEEARSKLASALASMLMQQGSCSLRAATTWLITHHPELFAKRNGDPLSSSSIRDRLPRLIGSGLPITLTNGPECIIIRAAAGKRGADEIGFAPQQRDGLPGVDARKSIKPEETPPETTGQKSGQ